MGNTKYEEFTKGQRVSYKGTKGTVYGSVENTSSIDRSTVTIRMDGTPIATTVAKTLIKSLQTTKQEEFMKGQHVITDTGKLATVTAESYKAFPTVSVLLVGTCKSYLSQKKRTTVLKEIASKAYTKGAKVALRDVLIDGKIAEGLTLATIDENSPKEELSVKVEISGCTHPRNILKSRIALSAEPVVEPVKIKTYPIFTAGTNVLVGGLYSSAPMLNSQCKVAKYSGVYNETVEVISPTNGSHLVSKDSIISTSTTPEVFFVNQNVTVKYLFGGYTDVLYECTVAEYPKPTDKKVKVRYYSTIHSVLRENITASKSKHTPYVPPKPVAKFKDMKKPSDDEKYMAELLRAKSHTSVITLGIEGINLELYNIQVAKKYTALIPKMLVKGDKVPCLIAHTDLHPNLTHPTKANLEYEKGKFTSPTGLGADDRAGIFTINKAIHSHPGKFMILFPDEEEIGCIGSGVFVLSKLFTNEFDKFASVYISIDRRREFNGDKTIATYGFNDDALNKYMAEKTNRKIVKGSSTDCRVLSAASTRNVPCINFSCGYTAEHTNRESLYMEELLETVDDIKTLLSDTTLYEKHTAAVTQVYGKYSNKNKTKPYTSGSRFDEFVEVGGEWFMPDDVQELLNVYRYFTGKEYSLTTLFEVPEVTKGDYVRADEELVEDKTYGGEPYRMDIAKVLKYHTWEIVKISDHGKLDLVSLDGGFTCSKIPRRWVVPVRESEALLIKKEK